MAAAEWRSYSPTGLFFILQDNVSVNLIRIFVVFEPFDDLMVLVQFITVC